jgi:hypothetical protein
MDIDSKLKKREESGIIKVLLRSELEKSEKRNHKTKRY